MIDLVRRLITRNDNPMHLTPKEYDLVLMLAKYANRVVTHPTLLASV